MEEAANLKSRLQTVTMKFEAMRKGLEETNVLWQREKELLTSCVLLFHQFRLTIFTARFPFRSFFPRQINKQGLALTEAQLKEEEFRTLNKKLHNDLKEAEKMRKSHEKLLLQLTKDREKLISQLDEELQNRLIAEQYLEIEKEKYQVLSTCKDKMIDELRSSMKSVMLSVQL